MSTATIPQKTDAPEKQLVEDMAETMSLHGYKVTKHTLTYDHERGESRLSVGFVKANPNQQVMKLHKDDGEGDGE
jgi:predicted RNA-binding protein with PUA-like domain